MNVSLGRRLPVLVVPVLAAAVLTGCGAGFDATSLKPYAPADGVITSSGDVRALNVLVVGPPEAPEAGGSSSGVVVMSLANTGTRPDRLSAIDTDAGSVTLAAPVPLPPGSAVPFSHDTEHSAVISGLTTRAGEAIELTLQFARAEPITVRTIVMPATGDYAEVTAPATLSAS